MKVLIDANVILDVLLNRSPWVTDSQAVWDANKNKKEIWGGATAVNIDNVTCCVGALWDGTEFSLPNPIEITL